MSNNNTVTFTNSFLRSSFKLKGSTYTVDRGDKTVTIGSVNMPSVVEWRIFLVLASKVNPCTDKEFGQFVYNRTKFAEEFGVRRGISRSEIVDLLKNLDTKSFQWDDGDSFESVSFLQRLKGKRSTDSYVLKLNDCLGDYIFIGNLKNNSWDGNSFMFEEEPECETYTSIPLKYIMCLKSTYAIRLYLYLYTFKGLPMTRKTMDNLKDLLGLRDLYTNNNFINKVLKPAIKEINEKTDLNIAETLNKKKGGGNIYTSCTFHVNLKEGATKIVNPIILSESLSLKAASIITVEHVDGAAKKIISTIKDNYDEEISMNDAYTLIGIAGGVGKVAISLYCTAIEKNATNKIAMARATAKKEGITPLKMYN